MLSRYIKYKPYPTLICAFVVLFLGILVIAAWFLDIDSIKHISSKYISMKFNTALLFVLISVALILMAKEKYRLFSIFISCAIGILSLVSLSQEMVGSLGLDEFFVTDLQGRKAHETYPGRMSPITSISFFCMSIGIMGLNSKSSKITFFAQYVFHFVTLLSFVAFAGYLFDVPKFYSLSFVTSIAIHTAFAFFILSIGAAALNSNAGFTSIFTGNGTGNRVGRQLFLQMLIFVVVFTYLRLESHKKSYVNVEFGIALMAISFILISLFLISKAVYTLNKSEKKQKLAEEHFKAVVESVPNALVASDANGFITLINLQAETLFGYKREEIVGKKIDILVPTEFQHIHPQNRENFHEKPHARFFGAGSELHAMRKDGSEFPVEIGLNPIINSNNETMILAAIIDITERKKQEALIERQIIELKIKNQEMEQFNYIASHDLQEPLRTVSNYIMLLEEDYEDVLNEEIKMHLETMNAAISRMNILVRSLLDFGRLGRNKKLSYACTKTIINNVTDDLHTLIKTTETKITFKGTLPELFVYETEFRQLLQNLLNNAIKFRKKDLPAEVVIGCRDTGKHFEFSVADNGIGIEKKYSERIFQIFQRLNKPDAYEGHGIGLANCKKIVEMHGGKIWVESTPGTGSTFKFTILKLNNEATVKLHHAG